MQNNFHFAWSRFWMHWGGTTRFGRLATSLATWGTPPYKGRAYLAGFNRHGFVSPDASVSHRDFRRGRNVFVGERVVIYQADRGGPVDFGDDVHFHLGSIVETGQGGGVFIGAETHVQPRCQFSAYKGSIRIGSKVQIAPYCSFYPYDHGFAGEASIMDQPIHSRGDIVIEDDAWLGVNVCVLDGVRIGTGAVIGAGSVVTSDIPDYAVAVGVPARVVKLRTSADLKPGPHQEAAASQGIAS
jgi:acetyltransferase-like isoleucine patch superfamily enzyme